MTLTALPPFDLELLLPPLPETATQRARELWASGLDAAREGRYEEASQAFATLGTLKNLEGAHNLSKLGMHFVWRMQGEFSKAVVVLKEALGLGDDRLVLLYIGSTLHQMERFVEALDVFDEVKGKWPDDPDVWVHRMAPLVSLAHPQDAFDSAERAFPLRHRSSDRGQTLYICAAHASVAFGLSALKRRWLPDLEAATKAFIKWRARARRDKQTAAFNQAVKEFKKRLSEEEAESFEEFMLGVRLASIRNPFRRWEAIGKEISKVWPEDVSAVEAIREQRRW